MVWGANKGLEVRSISYMAVSVLVDSFRCFIEYALMIALGKNPPQKNRLLLKAVPSIKVV